MRIIVNSPVVSISLPGFVDPSDEWYAMYGDIGVPEYALAMLITSVIKFFSLRGVG